MGIWFSLHSCPSTFFVGIGRSPIRARSGVVRLRLSSWPAIALTAYVSVEDRARALSTGFDAFVPKFVDPDELINAILNPRQLPAPDLLLSDSEM